MFNRSLIGSMLALALLFAVANTVAAPNLISVQGRITDPPGNPVADGSYLVQLRLYSAPVAGTTLWDNGYRTVPLAKGLFTYQLGDSTALPVSVFTSNPQLWLGIKVGTDPEISPRTQLVSVPYSKSADFAGRADTAQWSKLTGMPAGFADGVDDNTTYSGSAPISLAGTTFGLTLNSLTDAYISPSAAIAPTKISGTAATLAANPNSFVGTNNFNGILKVGDSAFYAYPTYAVQIGGVPTALTDRVLNISRTYNTAGQRMGLSTSVTNNGGGNVYGINNTAVSDGYNRYGIFSLGQAKTAGLQTGYSYGVFGRAQYGSMTFGVYGQAFGSGGVGTAIGIFGDAGGAYDNWAGFFNGYVNVSGVLSKGAGSFRIDHPLDPENKLLQHSFVESPDMMNIYNGNVTTDGIGDATITMPAWFDALNRDFRYQLTVIGQFAQAIVSSEMNGNTFSIKTDKASIKVSWQVTGIRKDAFANANRIQVEVDKQPDQRGKYLHPAAFNLSEERGIDYEQIKAAREAREQQKTDGPR